MKNVKQLLRHELLNVLTLFNFSIYSSDLKESEKKEFCALIKLANCLISYEGVFLGKKIKFCRQEVKLKDVLEITMSILTDTSKKVKVIYPKNELYINVDRNVFKECLEQIIKKLLCSISKIEFVFDEKKNQMSILHDADKKLDIKQEPITECLGDEDLLHSKIPFQLALIILDMHKIQIVSRKNKIVIIFPA